ncbi:transcriptional repressor [Dyadobacter subterraneus]|uniref:Transcriptional repressor n=1 Tax=Dyadobacter subterraneus TaxID=2773304 RepID=A0ABR9WG62_9BACT|nr:transcriptional repressor [Dyadobacter subterraneus]MBE9463326.1 transcriptional repressor [Dyadobacter subterraneus]
MSIEEKILLYFDQNNLRRSNKKILVAKYLTTYQTEVAAETLWIMIREKRLNISIASVYQALNWMVDLGYATKILKGRKSLYQIKETPTLSN